MKKNQSALEQRVLGFIRRHRLLEGWQLLVAVSGGPDSVCLLHLLVSLQAELGVALHVAHLDHRLRGAAGEADARYVQRLARRLGVPATVESRDVATYQAQRRLSPEEAAREVRYRFLAEVACAIGAERVAVGHTADDHVETILLHLVRGAGTRGLRGLQPLSQWRSDEARLALIRPLLPVSRSEVEAYCRSHRLSPRLDASNLSLSPLRNRVRHRLLPLLRGYNPQVEEALRRTARIAADEHEFLAAEAARLWGEVAQEHEGNIVLGREKLCRLPAALQRQILRLAVGQLAGDLKDIEARHIEDMLDALGKPAGKQLVLPGGLVFSVEYHRYLLGADPAALSPFPDLGGEYALRIPGETRLPGWRVTAEVGSRETPATEGDSFCACLDSDRAGESLLVRRRHPGDRFQPLGMEQPKKLNRFMADARIPRAWRQRVPLVCSPRQILWVVGWRLDDRVKVTGATRRVLSLRMERA